jgi:hypothetical protein
MAEQVALMGWCQKHHPGGFSTTGIVWFPFA